eukprot:107329-Amphidinium_carterae.1
MEVGAGVDSVIRSICALNMRAYQKGKVLWPTWTSVVMTPAKVQERIERAKEIVGGTISEAT